MKTFYDLPHDCRFEIYKALDALQCEARGAGNQGQLAVAVAKGQFSALTHALKGLGLEFVNLYKFPLGTDKPPMHLRHESHGFPDCVWLIANFQLIDDPKQ